MVKVGENTPTDRHGDRVPLCVDCGRPLKPLPKVAGGYPLRCPACGRKYREACLAQQPRNPLTPRQREV